MISICPFYYIRYCLLEKSIHTIVPPDMDMGRLYWQINIGGKSNTALIYPKSCVESSYRDSVFDGKINDKNEKAAFRMQLAFVCENLCQIHRGHQIRDHPILLNLAVGHEF